MKTTKKISFRRIALYLLLTAVVGAGIFLLLPGNYYIRKALLHWMPKIDQYTIFENRIVKAEDPHPWEFAPDLENKQIPKEFEADFAKYKTVGFVVIQHKKIILEQYWKNYSPLSLSNSFSMAKSIISLLIGCAIDDGAIKSVDQPVSDFLPEWTSFDGKVLTIKDLLTMSAGVEWDESYSSLFSKTTEAYYGNNLWNLTLTEKLVEKPGVRFNYQSGVTQILAFVLKKATRKNIADYASEKLWTPIQAEEDAQWSLDHKEGMEKAYCCFNSNARDFARLGQLILNKGSWNGVQVIDSNYIKAATTPATELKFTRRLRPGQTQADPPVPCTFYGYQIWLANYRGLKIQYMRGMLGQYIIAIPALDAVIVRLGKEKDKEFNIEQEYNKDLDIWLNAGLEVINKQ
jgi:CubicO group peptidase (beta-lactamase class C family)